MESEQSGYWITFRADLFIKLTDELLKLGPSVYKACRLPVCQDWIAVRIHMMTNASECKVPAAPILNLSYMPE